MSATTFPGWTLSEAFEKIVPDEFFLALQDANANADRATSFADSVMRRSEGPARVGEVLKAISSSGFDLRQAKQNIYSRFRYSARRGDVIVTGFANGDEYASVLPPQVWTELDGFLENISAVGRRPDDDQDALLPDGAFLAVSIFPVLRAPIEVTVEWLTSEFLSTVLGRFVWSDPEALKIWNDGLRRGERLPNDTPEISSDRAVLLALQPGAKKMRREIDRVGLADKLGLDATDGGSTASRYLDVLADRLAALGELIATGHIGLSGLDEGRGKRGAVDRDDIEAGRLLLCLGTGDLYWAGDDGGAIRNVRVTEASTVASEVGSAVEGVTSDEVDHVDDEGAPAGDDEVEPGERDRNRRNGGSNGKIDWGEIVRAVLITTPSGDRASKFGSARSFQRAILAEIERRNLPPPAGDENAQLNAVGKAVGKKYPKLYAAISKPLT